MGIVDPDSLAKQVTEHNMAWRIKEAENMRAFLRSLQEELEDEKYFRKHSKTLHRKLGKESSEMKSAFVRYLEKEKKMQSDDVTNHGKLAAKRAVTLRLELRHA
jgi:hypothetical protein